MIDKLKNVLIITLYALSLSLIYELDKAKFELEIAPLKFQIEQCLNSDEAKAVEKFNDNVREAINERRVQETGVCQDQR